MATDENAAERRYVTLRPRLQAAASLLNAADTLADIGCDHGKLGIALLQRGLIASVIGTDISEASLMKAQQLRGYAGLTDAMRLRQGDGLACIAPHEADALSICGMGGALIARIIAGAAIPLQGARYAVLQPMRGAEELRQYLFENGFLIETERIAADGGRLYQVMRVAPGRDTPPDWWPGGFFLLGPKAIGEPHFNKLADLLLRQYREHEKSARGTRAWRALSEKVLALETIVGHNAKER